MTQPSHSSKQSPESRLGQVLSAFLELSNVLETTTDSPQLAQLVLAKVVAAIDPDIACYYLPTASGQQVAAAATFPQDYWKDPSNATRFSVRELKGYAIGRAVDLKTPILIQDVQRAEGAGDAVAFSADIGSEIVTPVFVGDSLCVILVVSRHRERPLDNFDVAICSIVQHLLGIAYRAARERGNRNARTEFLRAVGMLSTDDPEAVFERSLDLLGAFLPTKFISLWLFSSVDDTLVIRSFYPPFIGHNRITNETIGNKVLEIGRCLSGQTVRSKRPMVFESIRDNPLNANGEFALQHGLDWFISFPILGDGHRVHGVVNIYPSVSRSEVGDDDLEPTGLLISQLSNVVAVAVLKRRAAISSSYRRLCRGLNFTQDPERSWNEVAAQIARDLDCEACSLFAFDHLTSDLALCGSTGLSGNPPYHTVRYRVGEGLTGRAFQTKGCTLYYRDRAELHSGVHVSKYREKLRTPEPSRSNLLVAITDDGGVALGVIRCVNKEESATKPAGRFTQEDISMVQIIGRIVAENFAMVPNA